MEILIGLLAIEKRLFTGKKPPEDMTVNERFRDVKDLKSKILKIINIIKVRNKQNIKILKNCLKISDELKAKKFVKVFLRLSSKISIKSNIENKKYRPPIH